MLISGHPIAAGERNPFFPAYSMLVEDLQRLLQYVHPCDANLGAFSHRTFELLLRACTEFESACKAALTAAGKDLPERPNISHFAALAPALRGLRVGALFWSPQKRFFEPFAHWNPPAGPSWFQAYGEVKHDRASQFEKASLENLLLATTGLCAFHFHHYGGHAFFNPFAFSALGMQPGADGSIEHVIDNSIFTVMVPKGA